MAAWQPRTLEAVVPGDAQPGKSELTVNIDDSSELVLKVPKEAAPGDWVKLTETSPDQWSITIKRRVQGPDAAKGRRKITCLVPPGVAPGHKLTIDVGDSNVLLTVPEGAKTADRLVLEQDATDGWKCTLVHDVTKTRDVKQLGEVRNLAPPRAQPMDDDVAYERLVGAVRGAGGSISSKMSRGSVAPLFIPGIVATAPIEAGEELCRLPRTLHLSPVIIKRLSPKLAAAMKDSKHLPTLRKDEALQSTFLAQMLLGAEARAVAARDNVDAPEEGYMPEMSKNSVDASVQRVYEAYGDVLLSQDFAYHPYRKAAIDPEGLRESMLPSPEVDYFIDMAGDVLSIHSIINDFCPKHLLGPRFENVGMFLRARLCVLSRVFQTVDDSTMVPIADLFNHEAGEIPGASWFWRPDENAMVIIANRAFSPGEEICDSYGPRPNTLVYRTYGFTQAPSIEPSWGIGLRPELVKAIFEVFLPPDQQGILMTLDAKHLDESLCEALNAAARNKSNACEFLRMLCAKCREPYLEDAKLKPALEALARARQEDPSSHAWWEQLGDGCSSLLDHEGIRIKMSEYLCLTAHMEAVACFEGRLQESEVFALALQFTRTLKDALAILREKGVFKMQFVPETSLPELLAQRRKDDAVAEAAREGY